MKEKLKNKKVVYTIIGIISILLVVVGVTYAYWLITRTQTKENVISTGCLDITLTDDSSAISLLLTEPVSDEDGKKLTPYTFTVTNNCNTNVDYQIALETFDTTETVKASSIKVMIDENDPLLLSTAKVIDPTIADATNSYVLKTGSLSGKETSAASKSHTLRIWVDANAPISEMNKTFESQISVTVGQGIENQTICKAVTEETKTTGNIPLGNYDNGDEYICEVKDDTSYHFFVIGEEETGEVNLIMDRSIISTGEPVTDTDLGLVAWVSQEEYATANTNETDTSTCNNSTCIDEGAITANNKLAEYVSNWTNIDDNEYNMTINVYNSDQKGSVILTNYSEEFNPLIAIPYTFNKTSKARLMTVEEAQANGCKVEYDETTDTGETIKHYTNSCPLYLSNHLEHKRGYVTGDGVVNTAAGIRGYWLLNGASPDCGWAIHDNGVLNARYANDTSYYGLRPVITLDKSDLDI